MDFCCEDSPRASTHRAVSCRWGLEGFVRASHCSLLPPWCAVCLQQVHPVNVFLWGPVTRKLGARDRAAGASHGGTLARPPVSGELGLPAWMPLQNALGVIFKCTVDTRVMDAQWNGREDRPSPQPTAPMVRRLQQRQGQDALVGT